MSDKNGRPCKSRTGKPSPVFGFRMPQEYRNYIETVVTFGKFKNFTEYLLDLIRRDAKKRGVKL